MKLRAVHWASLGALCYCALFACCMMFGLALEERYAQGWALLQHRDEIPWWQLAFHPVLTEVLLFPLGLIAHGLGADPLLVWGSVPAHGALLGWVLGRRKAST